MVDRKGIPYTDDERAAVIKTAHEFMDRGLGIVIIGADEEVPPEVVTTLNDAAAKQLYMYLLTDTDVVEVLLTDDNGNAVKKG